MSDTKEIRLNIRIKQDLKDRIDRAAEGEDRTMTSLVTHVMKKWLDEHYPEPTNDADNLRRNDG